MNAQKTALSLTATLFGSALLASTLFAGSASASMTSELRNCSSGYSSATVACCVDVVRTYRNLLGVVTSERSNCQAATECSKADSKSKYCFIRITRLRTPPARDGGENNEDGGGDNEGGNSTPQTPGVGRNVPQ